MSRDVTFFESVSFFASRGTSLQGEQTSGNKETSGDEELPLHVPIHVPSYHFDEQRGVRNKGESELKVYTRRKKHGRQEGGTLYLTSHNPLKESTSEPIPNSINVLSLSPSQCSNDLNQPIAHRKGVRSYIVYTTSIVKLCVLQYIISNVSCFFYGFVYYCCSSQCI